MVTSYLLRVFDGLVCGCEVFCMCDSFVTRKQRNTQPRTHKTMNNSFQSRIDTDNTKSVG